MHNYLNAEQDTAGSRKAPLFNNQRHEQLAAPRQGSPGHYPWGDRKSGGHHQQQNALPLRRPVIRQVLRKTPANAKATPWGDQRRLIKGSTRLRERPARNAHRQPAEIGISSTGYSNSSAKGHMEEQAMYRNLNAFMGFYLGFALMLIVAL